MNKREKKRLPKPELLLLHGRMRPCDRRERMKTLIDFSEKQKENEGFVPGYPGFIVIATQVIEAGLDISASRLWSEIAPWSSVIQRLGRLNRDDRQPGAKAFFWMPRPDKEVENSTKDMAPNAGRVGPYDSDDLKRAEDLLNDLTKLVKRPIPYPMFLTR